jgi:hypothetical protein
MFEEEQTKSSIRDDDGMNRLATTSKFPEKSFLFKFPTKTVYEAFIAPFEPTARYLKAP